MFSHSATKAKGDPKTTDTLTLGSSSRVGEVELEAMTVHRQQEKVNELEKELEEETNKLVQEQQHLSIAEQTGVLDTEEVILETYEMEDQIKKIREIEEDLEEEKEILEEDRDKLVDLETKRVGNADKEERNLRTRSRAFSKAINPNENIQEIRSQLKAIRMKYMRKARSELGLDITNFKEPVTSVGKFEYHQFRHKPIVAQEEEDQLLFSATDVEVLRTITAFDNRYVAAATGQFVFAILGIVLMIVENLATWNDLEHKYLGTRDVTKAWTGVLITLTTLISVWYTLKYYKVRVDEFNMQHRHHVGESATIWNLSGQRRRMLFEVITLLFHPIPFVGMDERFGLIMWIRLYLVTRMIKVYSPVYQARREIVRSGILHQVGNPRFSWQLSTKLLFTRDPVVGTIVFLIVIYIISTLNIFVTERNANDDFNLANSFWFSMVTMTTIGYGDYYPSSPRGRAAAMIGATAGILTMSLLTGVIAANLALDRKKELFRKYEFEEVCMEKYRNAAATCIQTVWRRYLHTERCRKEGTDANVRKIQKFYTKLQQAVRTFRQNYRRVENSRRSHTVDERLQLLEGRLITLEENVGMLFAESRERNLQMKELQSNANELLEMILESEN